MPNLRKRTLEEIIKKDLTWSRVVSVLGMRQVGKSTLLTQIGNTYFTLDDEEILRKLELGDWSEIEKGSKPVVIDEAQKMPGLFDRVKLLVDRRKTPGQFILTGSVRFLSKKKIRESLTGRTSLLELLPLTLAESHSRPMSRFFETLIKFDSKNPAKTLDLLSEQNRNHLEEAEDYISVGGMPGICFKRDETIRDRMREAHLETLLMRDLQFLIKTRIPYVKLKSILSAVAQTHLQSLSISALSRQVQLSTPTVIQLLQSLEDLFIIRSHGKERFFTDVGMASYLGASRISNPLFHMERFVYQELYAQLTYGYRAQFEFTSYASRGGVRIPFVVKIKNLPAMAFAVDPAEGASEKSLKGLTWYAKKQVDQSLCVVLHQGKTAYVASTGALCLPYFWIA